MRGMGDDPLRGWKACVIQFAFSVWFHWCLPSFMFGLTGLWHLLKPPRLGNPWSRQLACLLNPSSFPVDVWDTGSMHKRVGHSLLSQMYRNSLFILVDTFSVNCSLLTLIVTLCQWSCGWCVREANSHHVLKIVPPLLRGWHTTLK